MGNEDTSRRGTMTTVYFDGAYVPRERALIPPTDVGVIYGLGSFETLRIYDGVAFMAERHQARMIHTLEYVGVATPALDLRGIFETLSVRNEQPDARGRILVTGGTERPDGTFEGPRVYAETTAIRGDLAEIARGVKVCFASESLRPIAGFKSLSYLPNTLARAEARRVGAEEALLRAPGGEILEGATSNLHLVIEGRLTTPPADGRLLGGVTRSVVLEEAIAEGLEIDEHAIFDADLTRAEEAFLTSTIREITPIRDLAGRILPAPGPITLRLRDAYRRRVSAEISARRG
jgi:branched-chain amino acid aminotransferase